MAAPVDMDLSEAVPEQSAVAEAAVALFAVQAEFDEKTPPKTV